MLYVSVNFLSRQMAGRGNFEH